MTDLFLWFTRFENSKIFALLLFFTTFCAILLYLYTGKKRAERLESYKYMPLQDDEPDLNAARGGEEKNESDKS
ncbi:MAG: cbb3-type cytochrome c oxidase subunit 3 [Thiogranum sp.]